MKGAALAAIVGEIVHRDTAHAIAWASLALATAPTC
jgi:hypothetical protein